VREQVMELEGRLPDALVACVGGGSNAIGLFHPFLERRGGEDSFGVDAAGEGVRHRALTAAAIHCGRRAPARQHDLADPRNPEGQIRGGALDQRRPRLSPASARAFLAARRPAAPPYLAATDGESLEAFSLLAKMEGILRPRKLHALARLPEITKEVGRDGIVVLNLSGRGDKDVATVAAHLGRTI
jgi:tryptophan synthase beta chain